MLTSQVYPVIESLLSNVYCIKQTKIVDSWMMYRVGCLEVWCFIIDCFGILHFCSNILAWSSACITCTTFCIMCVCVRAHALTCLPMSVLLCMCECINVVTPLPDLFPLFLHQWMLFSFVPIWQYFFHLFLVRNFHSSRQGLLYSMLMFLQWYTGMHVCVHVCVCVCMHACEYVGRGVCVCASMFCLVISKSHSSLELSKWLSACCITCCLMQNHRQTVYETMDGRRKCTQVCHSNCVM